MEPNAAANYYYYYVYQYQCPSTMAYQQSQLRTSCCYENMLIALAAAMGIWKSVGDSIAIASCNKQQALRIASHGLCPKRDCENLTRRFRQCRDWSVRIDVRDAVSVVVFLASRLNWIGFPFRAFCFRWYRWHFFVQHIDDASVPKYKFLSCTHCIRGKCALECSIRAVAWQHNKFCDHLNLYEFLGVR